jgi:hypothetical protein
MILLRRLLVAELLGLAALLLVALALATYGAWDSDKNGSENLFGEQSAAQFLFLFTLVLGALPVIVIGAPGYVFLHSRRLARWPLVLLLGTAPSLLFLFFSAEFFPWALGCGAAVAILTHLAGSQLRGKWSLAPE